MFPDVYTYLLDLYGIVIVLAWSIVSKHLCAQLVWVYVVENDWGGEVIQYLGVELEDALRISEQIETLLYLWVSITHSYAECS